MISHILKFPVVLLLLWGATALGQVRVPEAVVPFAPIVAECLAEAAPGADVKITWWVQPGAVSLPTGDQKSIHIWAPPGRYEVVATCYAIDWTAKKFDVVEHSAIFSVTGDPVPVPPGPGPGPGPTPPEPPGPTPPTPPTPVVGPLTAIIVHETEDTSTSATRMFVALRTGANAKWLKDKGHKLIILDDDSTDESGNQIQVVAALKSLGLQMPALFVLDSKGAVVAKRELPESTTGDNIIEYIRQAGG